MDKLLREQQLLNQVAKLKSQRPPHDRTTQEQLNEIARELERLGSPSARYV